jgi:hypothetical protein
MDDAARIADKLKAMPLIDFSRVVARRHQDHLVGEDRLTDLSRAVDCVRNLLSPQAIVQTGDDHGSGHDHRQHSVN